CGDAEGRILVWSLDNARRPHVLQGRGETVWAVGWSPDSRRMAWGYRPPGPGKQAKLQRSFDLDHGAPGADPREGETWRGAAQETPGLVIEQPAAGDRVVLRAERRPAVTIKPDPELEGKVLAVCDLGAELVAVGTEYTLNVYDLTGRRVAVLAGHSGPVLALAKSPDGRLLASSSMDQTVRLWPLAGPRATPRPRPNAARDGRERQPSTALPQAVRPLLSLFMGRDRQWVAWSSGGFYACSPGGEEVVGWQVNHGPDQAADYVTAYELRRKLYRPDIIAKLGRASSLAEAMLSLPSGTGSRPTVTVDEANVEKVAPPRVEILAPLDGSATDAGEIEVRARAVDPNGRAIASTTLRINGRPARFVFVPARGEPGEWSSKVSLPPGTNTLTAVATNDDGAEGVSPPCRVTCREAGGTVSKPALYVLSVGVSSYRSAGLSLQLAAKDARDLAAGWATQQGKLYDKVETKVLTDQSATRAATLGGLKWLAEVTRQQDYAVLFLAGHGVSDADGTYYFLTHEADLHALPATAVKWDELRDGLDQVRGRVLLLLDTCHAGAATGPGTYDQGYNDMLRDARQEQVGLITFASCLPQQSSLESAQWGNGAFTKAVVEGLQGGPQEMLYDGKLTISALEAYVSARVEELTDGRQSPSLNKPTSVPSSLPVAVLQ
ncbi:MAG: caspase family protein, partial [Armatimonadetes bacterium]|nr:caspase family protein [Armatimonadota bacterium]